MDVQVGVIPEPINLIPLPRIRLRSHFGASIGSGRDPSPEHQRQLSILRASCVPFLPFILHFHSFHPFLPFIPSSSIPSHPAPASFDLSYSSPLVDSCCVSFLPKSIVATFHLSEPFKVGRCVVAHAVQQTLRFKSTGFQRRNISSFFQS